MLLMLIPQLAFKLPFCNQINLLCAAVEALAINYMTTATLTSLGWIFSVDLEKENKEGKKRSSSLSKFFFGVILFLLTYFYSQQSLSNVTA